MASEIRCSVCGASPAKILKLRRCVGMLIVWRWWSLDQPFCREHGQEAAKSWLGQTFAMGWRGVIGFFANIAAVLFRCCCAEPGLGSPSA